MAEISGGMAALIGAGSGTVAPGAGPLSSYNHQGSQRSKGAILMHDDRSASFPPLNQCDTAPEDNPAAFHKSVFVSGGCP